MTLIQKLQAHSDRAWSVVFSPNSAFLATCCADGSVNIYQILSKNSSENSEIDLQKVLLFPKNLLKIEQIQTLKHPNTVRSIVFSSDSQILYCACYDLNIYVYQFLDEKFQPLATLDKAHQKEIKSISIQNNYLVSCARDRCIHVWKQNETYPDDFECMSVLKVHTQDIKCVTFDQFDLFASCGYDNRICVFKKQFTKEEGVIEYKLISEYKSPIADEDCLQTANEIGGTVWCVQFLGNSQLIVSDQFGVLTILNYKNEKMEVVKQYKVHQNDCYKVNIEQNSKQTLVTCGSDGVINILKMHQNLELKIVKQIKNSHVGEVNCVAIQENLMATVGDDGSLCLYVCE